MNKFRFRSVAALFVLVCVLFVGCTEKQATPSGIDLSQVPEFSGEPYVAINNNQPQFQKSEITDKSFEQYAELDALGRCGVAMACIGRDIMPTEEREGIGQIKPSGWHTIKYDFVDGKYLYNRCHLIGYQLAGENANEQNLITGTRYLNVEGMLPFENEVASYVRETGNHVMYRVSPIFDGDNLVASGVQMEAWSVEDQGEGVCFNVYVYNNQPGVDINYADGTSTEQNVATEEQKCDYVLNTNSKKFHKPDCAQAENISEKNRQDAMTTRQRLIDQGYAPAGCCDP